MRYFNLKWGSIELIGVVLAVNPDSERENRVTDLTSSYKIKTLNNLYQIQNKAGQIIELTVDETGLVKIIDTDALSGVQPKNSYSQEI